MLQKILYFTLGEIVVPLVMGVFNALIFKNDSFEYFYPYFLLVFLVCYLLFPLIYREKMLKICPHRYVVYVWMYFFFELLGIGLYLTLWPF